MRRLPSLKALAVFEAAARRLSFAQAADELGLTPTAVSHQVRALEAALGRPLFLRRPRPLRLSPEGEKLARVATDALDQLGVAWKGLAHAPAHRPLVVSATRAFASTWLAPRLGWLAERLSAPLQIEVSEAPADLHSEGVDLALRYRRLAPAGLGVRALAQDNFVAVAHPTIASGPLRSAAELRALPLLHGRWASAGLGLPDWRTFLDGLSQSDCTARAVDVGRGILLGEEAQVIAAALEGQGAAIVSELLVADAIASGKLVKLLPHREPGAMLFAVWLPTSPRSAEIEALADLLAEGFAAGAEAAGGTSPFARPGVLAH